MYKVVHDLPERILPFGAWKELKRRKKFEEELEAQEEMDQKNAAPRQRLRETPAANLCVVFVPWGNHHGNRITFLSSSWQKKSFWSHGHSHFWNIVQHSRTSMEMSLQLTTKGRSQRVKDWNYQVFELLVFVECRTCPGGWHCHQKVIPGWKAGAWLWFRLHVPADSVSSKGLGTNTFWNKLWWM